MSIDEKRVEKREYGIDLLRASAISLVFFLHIAKYLPDYLLAAAAYGKVGVDLFFVLSGFLIGSQFLSSLERMELHSALKQFYLKRSTRILGPYFITILIYYAASNFRKFDHMPSPLRLLTFTQNISIDMQAGFFHSWSLCIEEHFYLAFPFIAYFLYKTKSRVLTLFLIGAILISEIFLRFYLYEQHSFLSDIIHPRFTTFAMLDGLTIGVSLSTLSLYRKILWHRILNLGHFWLFSGIMLISLSLLLKKTINLFLAQALEPTIFAIAFSAILIWVLSPSFSKLSFRIPGATKLSTLSYSFYLVHPIIVAAVGKLQERSHSLIPNLIWILLAFVCSLVTSNIMYLCIEEPSFKIRKFYLKKMTPKLEPNDVTADAA